MSKQIIIPKSTKAFLGRSEDTSRYFNDMRKYKRLTEDETDQLFYKYHQTEGVEKGKIRDKIICANLRLVITVARAYCTNREMLSDLIEEGNIGLIKAIDAYDVNKASCFQKLAIYYILQHINQYKIDCSHAIHKSNGSKTFFRAHRINENFIQKEGRYPTIDELFEIYNSQYPNSKIKEKNDLENVTYVEIDSFDAAANNDDTAFYGSYCDYHNASSIRNFIEQKNEHEFLKEKTKQLINHLDAKEQKIIRLYFGLEDNFEHSFRSIGDIMGITANRVGQLYNRAMDKLSKLECAVTY